MRKGISTGIRLIIFLFIGAFFIWIFVRNLTPEEKNDILLSIRQANYWWIIAAVFLALLSHISRTFRWKMLLEGMGYKPSTKNTFLAIMVGYFANLALPRLGEISRCGILAKYENIPVQKSLGSVVTERGLDLITFFLFFVINLMIHFNKITAFKKSVIYRNARDRVDYSNNAWLLIITVIIVVCILIYILYRYRRKISHLKIYQKIRNIILGFFQGLKSLILIKRPWWFVFHSVFIWVMYLLMTWVVFFSLPETAFLGLNAGLAVLVFGTVGIIVVQGGIGIYPWIVAETLLFFSIPHTTGYAMGWLLWIGQTAAIAVTGLISMIILPFINTSKK